MAGVTNSWIGNLTEPANPCIATTSNPLASNCWLWLIAGLLIGSLTFGKKGSRQV